MEITKWRVDLTSFLYIIKNSWNQLYHAHHNKTLKSYCKLFSRNILDSEFLRFPYFNFLIFARIMNQNPMHTIRMSGSSTDFNLMFSEFNFLSRLNVDISSSSTNFRNHRFRVRNVFFQKSGSSNMISMHMSVDWNKERIQIDSVKMFESFVSEEFIAYQNNVISVQGLW